jgi:Uma2 family endonuclease
MPAVPATTRDERGAEDDVVLLRDATWADYQRLLELRGDRSAPRLAFLEGALEIMTPSRFHEVLKSLIGRLVEVWCLEQGVEFSVYGSWTLESKEAERGIEPDECYVFGDVAEPERPDLAIEVAWSPPRVDKLAIYARLGVPEVWIWRRERISIHTLRGDSYEESPASQVLPGIDLDELASFLDRPTASQAIRAYRARLAGG